MLNNAKVMHVHIICSICTQVRLKGFCNMSQAEGAIKDTIIRFVELEREDD